MGKPVRNVYRLLATEVAVVALSSLSLPVFAQQPPRHIDPASILPDMYEVLLDNEHVRVVEYRIEPGEKDDWHTHPPKASYVVSGGTLRITLENGESFVVAETAGSAAWLGAVGLHFGENIGDTPVRIVFIEIKSIADAPFEPVADPN